MLRDKNSIMITVIHFVKYTKHLENYKVQMLMTASSPSSHCLSKFPPATSAGCHHVYFLCYAVLYFLCFVKRVRGIITEVSAFEW